MSDWWKKSQFNDAGKYTKPAWWMEIYRSFNKGVLNRIWYVDMPSEWNIWVHNSNYSDLLKFLINSYGKKLFDKI